MSQQMTVRSNRELIACLHWVRHNDTCPEGRSATPPWSTSVAERSFAAAMLSLAVTAAGSTLDPGGGAPGAGSEAVDLPLIHCTPTFFVYPIGHRSMAFLDLVTALGGGLRTKLDAPTASSGRVPKVITH